MQKIVPNLWFDHEAEEAANFYTSIFPISKIINITHYGDAGAKAAKMPKGSVLTVHFQLAHQDFVAINGGPVFTFTPAISLAVDCKTQEEVDRLWNQLSQDGEILQCGWLTDKYGLSWQIIPSRLQEMLNDPNQEKVEKVMEAMLKMKKLDIATLEKAYA